MPYAFTQETVGGNIATEFHRIEAKGSGLLIASEAIGAVRAVTEQEKQSNLFIPSLRADLTPSEVIDINTAAAIANAPEYQNLDELVEASVVAWRGLLRGCRVLSSRLDLVGFYEEITEEQTTESGLVIPGAPYSDEFRGYTATPNEIEAMERVANLVEGFQSRSSDDEPQPGNYL